MENNELLGKTGKPKRVRRSNSNGASNKESQPKGKRSKSSANVKSDMSILEARPESSEYSASSIVQLLSSSPTHTTILTTADQIRPNQLTSRYNSKRQYHQQLPHGPLPFPSDEYPVMMMMNIDSTDSFEPSCDSSDKIGPPFHPNPAMSTPVNTIYGNGTNNSGLAGGPKSNGQHYICNSCKQPILERFMLQAVGEFWHEDCLKCSCCDCRLAEAGSTLYLKQNLKLLLCRRDYLRLFGNAGTCAACHKTIPACEMVMRARNNVYHLQCFACCQCHQSFCVGDRFYLCGTQILCEYDYEERMMFANLKPDPHQMAQLKQQLHYDSIPPGGEHWTNL